MTLTNWIAVIALVAPIITTVFLLATFSGARARLDRIQSMLERHLESHSEGKFKS